MSFKDDNSFSPDSPEPSPPSLEIDPTRPTEREPNEAMQAAPASITPSIYPSMAGPSIEEDLRVPWGWSDLFLFVAIALIGAFSIALLVMGSLAIFGGPGLHRFQASPTGMNLLTILIQVLLDLGLLAYLAAQIRLRYRFPFWRTIGWRPLESGAIPRGVIYFGLVLGGILLSIIVTFVSDMFPPKTQLPIQVLFQDRYTALLFILIAVLLAPLVEETVFRGYIYPVVARSFGKIWGIVITGTLFGLLHASQLWGGWGQIALLIIVGMMLTIARAASRTVVSSFILHTSYNSLQVIGLLIATHGLRHFPMSK